MSTTEDRLRAALQDAPPTGMTIDLRAVESAARRQHHRATRRKVSGGAVATMALAALIYGVASSGSTSSSHRSPPSTSTTTSSPDVTSTDGEYTLTATWLDVGRQIRAARAADPHMSAVIPVTLSAPVDVTARGTYVMEIGPVPNKTRSQDVSMTLPPDMADHFILQGSPLQGLTLVQRDGQTFVQVHLHVTQVRSPYHHLTAWFQ